MRTFIKILATLFFIMIWGQLASGCLQGAKSTGGGAVYAIMNICNLVLLFGGLYGIWKFNPDQNKDKDDEITLKKD